MTFRQTKFISFILWRRCRGHASTVAEPNPKEKKCAGYHAGVNEVDYFKISNTYFFNFVCIIFFGPYIVP